MSECFHISHPTQWSVLHPTWNILWNESKESTSFFLDYLYILQSFDFIHQYITMDEQRNARPRPARFKLEIPGDDAKRAEILEKKCKMLGDSWQQHLVVQLPMATFSTLSWISGLKTMMRKHKTPLYRHLILKFSRETLLKIFLWRHPVLLKLYWTTPCQAM